MTNQPIRNWYQDFWFLDNSYEVPIAFGALVYPSVTHAFAAAQAESLDLKLEISKAPLSAIEGLFSKIGAPPSDFRGPDTMRKLLEYKFGVTKLLEQMTPFQVKMACQLIFTGRRPLIYGNMVCNEFWGDCACPKHLEVRGKNVLGGLIMSVREKLIEHVTKGVAKNQTCNCEKVNEAFFLYARDGKIWIKPVCSGCQAQAGIFLAKGSDNNMIYRFEKDWFKEEKQPSAEPKKRSIITPQVFHHGIHPVFNESGIDLEDEEYAEAWMAAAWGGHIQMGMNFKKEPEGKPLAKNITYYLSGRIS